MKTEKTLSLPNFIIAGATASGTSFLTDILMQQKEIYLPKSLEEEPHFFSLTERFLKGIEGYKEQFFSQCLDEKAIGERSSSYLHFPETAERLHKYLPHVKLIFVLRNPIDRAFAQYRYMVLRGIEKLDFKQAVEIEKKRLDTKKRHHEYVGRSLYGKQIELYLKFFSSDQILIISSENLRKETIKQLKRVTDFLNVAPLTSFDITSDFHSPGVKNIEVQQEISAHFGKDFKYLIEAIRYKKEDLSIFCKTPCDKEFISKLLDNLSYTKEPLSDEMKCFMKPYFVEDQKIFFHLIGKKLDFEPWIF